MNTKTSFSYLTRTATLVRAAGARATLMLLLLLVTTATAWAEADLIIRSEADWNTFAANVANGTNDYAGKTVILAADISVSTMAGADNYNFFRGTFDGCGHTLTINYTGGYAGTAPFRRIENATIKNLNVTGTITTNSGMAGSIAFVTNGITHITNCLSTVSITGNSSGTDGGLVSCNNNELYFTNCAFKGELLGTDVGFGGFVGWNNVRVVYNHCLFAPSQVTMSTNGSSTFTREASNSTSNYNNSCLYTQSFGTVQGYNASSMSNAALLSALGDGWEIRDGNVVPKKPLTYLAYHTATQSFVELSVDNPTIVGASTTTMGAADTETWCLVSSDVTIGSRITVNGTVHLILCDGATLTASQGITVSSGNKLNIYGQTAGTGALNATGVKVGGDGTESAAIGSVGGSNNVFGSVTIHGGHITADGAEWSAGIGGGVNNGGGSVAIYGGTVNATGHDGTSEAIGRGSSGGTVGKTLADGLRVTTYNNTTPFAYGNRVNAFYEKVVKVEPCTSHNLNNNVCSYCGLAIYTVTYNSNYATSGTVPAPKTSYQSGQTVTVLGNTGNLVRTGYTFSGWNTAANGLGTDYTAGTTFAINNSLTLYAKWTPIGNYADSYIAYNDATGDFETRVATNYIEITESTTSLSNGFYVARAGHIQNYNRITVSGTVHLILCDGADLWWAGTEGGVNVKNGATLHIYGQSGGTGKLTAGSQNSDPGIGPGNVIVHGGFLDAHGSAAGGAAIGGKNGSLTGGTLTVRGGKVKGSDTRNNHVICCNATITGGTVEVTQYSQAFGGTITLGNMKVYSSADATTPVDASQRESICRNTYVKIVPCTEHNFSNKTCTYCGLTVYNVTYNTNNATGGVVPVDNTVYLPSETVTVLGNTGYLVRTGYTFGGWNTKADGSGTTYAAGATFTINGNTTLYAKWTPITYTVRFHKNHDDATGSMNDQTLTYDAAQTLTANAFTRDGYAFVGWSTTPDGIVAYTDGQSLENLANEQYAIIDLYAKWMLNLSLANNDSELPAGDRNISLISTHKGESLCVTLADRTLYRDGDWNTLCLPFALASFTGTPLEGATVKTLTSSDFSDGTLTMNFSDDLTSIEAGKPYIVKWEDADLFIRSEDDWNTFATNVNNGTESYQGKTVKLAADISVTTMVGSSSSFKGTFDGCGHTLTFNYNATANDCAPFRYIDGATIRNLRVAGAITTSQKFAAGIAAYSYNNCVIENCQSSITITATISGDGTHAGFIAYPQSGTINFRNCLFDGKLLGSNTSHNGGFVGYRKNACSSIAYTNCLFAPTELTMSTSNSCTFNRNDGNTFTNTYYTKVFGTAQGTSTTATGEALRALLGDGWEVSGGNVVPKMVSGIENPVFTNVTISDALTNVSTTYADLIGSYAPFNDNNLLLDAHNPNGEAMHAALNIASPDKTGYTFGGWYSDASMTKPATTIPFAANGTVTLYAKWMAKQLELANNDDNGDAIDLAVGDVMYYDVTLANRTLYRDGDWNTLCLPFALASFTGTPLEGATVKTLTSSDFSDGTLTMNFSDDLTSIDAGVPYIVKWDADLVIRSATDWNAFATNVNNGTETYEGKTVKLAADISVTTMVGNSSNLFKGTFDGCGHTLNVSLSGGACTAPFSYVGAATIRNLKVDGSVTTTGNMSSGLVGFTNGALTITNCVSSVTLSSSYTGNASEGGIMGIIDNNSGNVTIEGCAFKGKILTTNGTTDCGGIVGWRRPTNVKLTIKNCLYAPAALASSETEPTSYSKTICRYGNTAPTITNCYYTRTLGDSQGTNASGMSNENLVSNLGDGWEVSGGNVVPKMANTVNDIVNPVFTGVTISNTTANVSTDYVDFVGTYSPVVIYESGEKHNLYLGSGNNIYYPTREGYEVNACRAYFRLNGLTAGDPNAGVRAFVLNFGEDSETGIRNLTPDPSPNGERSNYWYSLDGRRLNGKPTASGVYINNGRKIVIK